MEIDELKIKLDELSKKIETIKNAIKVDDKKEEIKELEKKTLEDGFWNFSEESSRVLSRLKEIKSQVSKYESVKKSFDDINALYELAVEENDNDSFKEAKSGVSNLEKELDNLEIITLFKDPYDKNNAIITIHPGAGGTESQDWALMLYRMYTRWAEKSNFEIEVLDYQAGLEAGIKSVSFLVKGENTYGLLKGESGVHRLVRISPFDANSRRHTSFAGVEVLPEISDDITIDIRPEDIQMDVYRASGAGGQHINKTSSAVRLKHIPTGIVVTCQTERSQMQNREYAMKMLKAKLYKREKENYNNMMSDIKGEVKDNGWGSQIRSYVFCPYTLVKDHRTNYETSNVEAVMDGDIDEFIYEYLKSNV